MTKQFFTGKVVIVGKICSGKTTLANSIKKELNALQHAVIITDNDLRNNDVYKNKLNIITVQTVDVLFNERRNLNCVSRNIEYIIFMTFESYNEFRVIGKYGNSHETYIEKYEHFKTPYNYVVFNVMSNKFSESTNFMEVLKSTQLGMNNLETEEKKNVIGNVVIYGMKGSGKTTLAKKIENNINPYQSVVIYEENNMGCVNEINNKLQDDVINILMYDNAPTGYGIKNVMYHVFLDEISMIKFINYYVIGTPQDKENAKEYFKTSFSYALYNGKTNRFYYDTTVEILMEYDSKVKKIEDFPYNNITDISVIGARKSGKHTLAETFYAQFEDEIGNIYLTHSTFENVEGDSAEIMVTNNLVTNTMIINRLSHIIMMDKHNIKEFESMFKHIPDECVTHLDTKYNFIVYDIKKEDFTMYSAVKLPTKQTEKRKINGCKNIFVLTYDSEKYSNFIKNEDVTFTNDLPIKFSDIKKIKHIVITDSCHFPKFEKLYGKIPERFTHLNQHESLWYSVDTDSFDIINIEDDRFATVLRRTVKNNKNTISLFIINGDNYLIDKKVFKVIDFSKEKYDNDPEYYNEFVKYTSMLSHQEDFKHTIITSTSSLNIPKSFMGMFTLVYVWQRDTKCVFFNDKSAYPLMLDMKSSSVYN